VNPNRRTNETEQRTYEDERRIRRPLRPRAVAPASVIILLFVCRKPVTPLDSTHEHLDRTCQLRAACSFL
jgi:hypothetical protein